MAFNVGNLLNDPLATSFASLEYANEYVSAEVVEGQRKSVNVWMELDNASKEATLVKASRWLATHFNWSKIDLTEQELAHIANIAVRLAVSSITIDLYEAINTQKQKQSIRAGSVSVAYAQTNLVAHAAGVHWPWLIPALDGYIYNPRNRLGVLVA